MDLYPEVRPEAGGQEGNVLRAYNVLTGWNRLIPDTTREAFDGVCANEAVTVGTLKSDLGVEAAVFGTGPHSEAGLDLRTLDL